MDLRVMEYFLAVAEHGTVSAAAERLFVSQPAVSRQLVALERELGSVLFTRTAAGMKLTAAGARFRPIAQDILWRARNGTAVMRGLARESVDVVIACPPTVLRYVVAPFLAERQAPVKDIREHPPEQVYREVLERRADVAIGTFVPPPVLDRLPFLEIPVTAQGVESNPLLGSGEPLELTQLDGVPLLVSRSGSALRQVLAEAAEREGLHLEVGDGVSSGSVAQALAAGGRGVAVVVEPAEYGLRSRAITQGGRALAVRDWAAWDPGHYAAEEIRGLVRELEKWCHNRFSKEPGA